MFIYLKFRKSRKKKGLCGCIVFVNILVYHVRPPAMLIYTNQ